MSEIQVRQYRECPTLMPLYMQWVVDEFGPHNNMTSTQFVSLPIWDAVIEDGCDFLLLHSNFNPIPTPSEYTTPNSLRDANCIIQSTNNRENPAIKLPMSKSFIVYSHCTVLISTRLVAITADKGLSITVPVNVPAGPNPCSEIGWLQNKRMIPFAFGFKDMFPFSVFPDRLAFVSITREWLVEPQLANQVREAGYQLCLCEILRTSYRDLAMDQSWVKSVINRLLSR